MPKRIIKKYLPNHESIRDHKQLRFLGRLLHDPNIWHLNRRSVAGAFSVGLFFAFIPLPLQMLGAASLAIAVRANLPISVALTWITNPLTMAPVIYASYTLGAWILGMPTALPSTFELSFDYLWSELKTVGKPFVIGTLILGALAALVGNIFVQIFWRFHIFRYVRQRRARRERNVPPPPTTK